MQKASDRCHQKAKKGAEKKKPIAATISEQKELNFDKEYQLKSRRPIHFDKQH